MEYETYETEEAYYDDMNAREGSKTKVQMQIYSRIRNNKILDKTNLKEI